MSQYPSSPPPGIPVREIIARCDELFNAEKSAELGEFLCRWRRKAREMKDLKGELSILNELIGRYRMAKDEEQGLAAVRDAQALLELLPETAETLSAGTILLNCATALHSFGRTPEALRLYDRAGHIYKKELPPDDERMAGLYNNMAAALCADGQFPRAEYAYLKALEILRTGKNAPDSAVTCLNLAQLYRSWNNDEMLISGMLACAWEYLDLPGIRKEGYYAHTCRKCAPGFSALGRQDIADELNKRADEYYAGH